MLREGKILIEDSPKRIFEKFQLELEDVFALLCKRKGVEDFGELAGPSRDEKEKIESEKKNFSWQRLKILTWKEFLVLKRQFL